jgi:probable lipoprotein NlpC
LSPCLTLNQVFKLVKKIEIRLKMAVAKLKALVPLIFVFVVLILIFEACKGGKSGSASGSRAKVGWLARLFGKGKSKTSSESVAYTSKEVEKIIKTARSYRGTPHRDGGMNKFGIDCSALMMISFESAGLKIPRNSGLQSQIGKPIEKKNLRPGDLVFFSDRKMGKGITHVGLVTEVDKKGEIKFIHTSSRLGVTENLLSTDYFAKTYAKGVRPF